MSDSVAWMATALGATLGFFTVIVYDTFQEESAFCTGALPTFVTIGKAGCWHA